MKKKTPQLEETHVQMESLDLDLLSDFHKMLVQLSTPSLGGWLKPPKQSGKVEKDHSGEKTRHMLNKYGIKIGFFIDEFYLKRLNTDLLKLKHFDYVVMRLLKLKCFP